MLLKTARFLVSKGHDIAFVWTSKSENYYNADENDFKILADDNKCIFLNTTDLQNNLEIIRSLKVDVCISINWINKVPKEFRRLFKYGVLNGHGGDLPRYRGNACLNWAILNFEKEVGLTIHKMVDQLDAGPYLHKEYLSINDNTYIGEIYLWLENTFPNAFHLALNKICSIGFLEQDPDIIPLRTFPRRNSDSKIDWTKNSKDIIALIRSSSHPFDGAYCFLNSSERLKLNIFFACYYRPEYQFNAVPGQVCLVYKQDVIIASGDGMVRLMDYSLDGAEKNASTVLISKSLRNRLI